MNDRNLSRTGIIGSAVAAEPLEITLPSGAIFPDWSCITSPQARAALDAVFEVERLDVRWAGLGADEDRVRRAVLEAYLTAGRAPTLGELGQATGFDAGCLTTHLAELVRRDIVVAGGDGDAIAGAYPFVGRSRGHRLRIEGVGINAMCAIDALGAGAMCGADAVIDSACAHCGGPIHIETRDRGAALALVVPADAVVRVGIEYANDCAADSICRVMSFFCSDAHLESWRDANHAHGEDYRLSMDEALQIGKAVFAPMLKEFAHER